MERLCSGQFVSCYLQKRLVFSSSFKKDIFIIKGIIRSNVQKAVGIWYSTKVSCPYIKVDYLFPKLLIICLSSSPSLPKVKAHFYCRRKDQGGKWVTDNTAKCQTKVTAKRTSKLDGEWILIIILTWSCHIQRPPSDRLLWQWYVTWTMASVSYTKH